MRRWAVAGAALVLLGTGCLQILGDEYALPCADVEGCQACFECTNQGPCAAEAAACDEVCLAYVDCTLEEGCEGSSCDDGCNAAHPGGQASFNALYECGDALCSDACGL